MTRGTVLTTLVVCAVTALLLFGRASSPARMSEDPASSMFGGAAAVSRLDTDKGIRQFETRVREDPRDFISLTVLGQLYARKGRETSDLSRFRAAEQAFREALRLNPDHTPAQAQLASAYASQHKFAEALEITRALYEQSPANLEALATLADVYLDTGDYDKGEDAVQTLAKKAGDVPAILARRALIAERKGYNGEAATFLQRAATMLRKSADPAQEIAWYEARLGDVYFQSGCLGESEKHYRAALELFPDYPIGLSGLAEVRAAQGRLNEAVDLYTRSVAASPEPSGLFHLGALHDRLGQQAEAQRHYARGEELARRDGVHQPAYYRALASFYADRVSRPKEALDLAQKDLALRKDVDAYDTLAWALYRNNRYEEAAAASAEAMKLGTHGPGIYYHAGMIHDALGQPDKARDYLHQALLMSPHMFKDDARRTLQKLGGRVDAPTRCSLPS